MVGCPDIDGISIKRNGFGQIGVPLHPSNGLVVGANGVELNSVLQSFNTGLIEIEINNVPVPSVLRSDATSVFSRINNTVTVLFTWNLSAVPGGSGQILEWSLPFEADVPVVAHSMGRLRDVGIGNYPRLVLLYDSFTIRLVTSNLTGATTTSPAFLGAGDSIFFACQYECKPDAQLLWS